MEESKKHRRIRFGVFIILLVIAFVYSLVFCSLKTSWFVDEVYSYGLVNSNYMPFLPATDDWWEADDYMDYVAVVNDPMNFGSVIFNHRCSSAFFLSCLACSQ